jgi:hypothetical protein
MNQPRLWWTAIAGLSLGLAVASFPAHASTRNYLTVEGRVFDHLGRPLPDTWVICTGSRRASMPVDSLGRYHLEIPGATLEELERQPLKIRIQARRKGYRFALSNGAPELGLEMRVVKDESPLSRLRVRSNDSSSVSAVANSVVLDANPRALLTAQFIGSPGAQYDTPPVPLEESDEITLAGSSPSIPELVAAEATSAAPAATSAPKPQPATPAPAAPPVPKSQPVTATPAQPVPARPAPGSADRDAPGDRAPVAKAVPPAEAIAAPATPAVEAKPASPEEPPLPGAEPRKWNAGGSDRDSKPRVVRPALDPGHPDDARSPAPGKPARVKQRSSSTTPKAPFTIEVRPASPDSLGTGTGTGAATVPAVPVADSGTARAGDATPAMPEPVAVTPAADPSLKPVLPKDMPSARVMPGAQLPIRRVPSAPGVPVPAPRRAAESASAPMCDCTIRGTVEVQWDRPLTSRTEVVIAVEDAPDVSASVELFMGSPRAFEIHPAPCGVHRLLLWTRSKQRFVLVSQEPRVVCTPGGVQQMRLVLEPVARWGAGQ